MRQSGVEPASAAYRAAALPLSYRRIVRSDGIEPSSPVCRTGALPLDEPRIVPQVRIERTPPAFQASAQTIYATGACERDWSSRPFTSSIWLSENRRSYRRLFGNVDSHHDRIASKASILL